MVGREMTRIKVCGITSLEDALLASDCGVDAIGFIFTESRRRISPEHVRPIVAALPPFITTVGVFLNNAIDTVIEIAKYTGIDVVQLHGNESPDYCNRLEKPVIKRLPVKPGDSANNLQALMGPFPVSAFMLDPGAGNGKTFDWKCALGIKQRLIIAGGLTPENVQEPVSLLSPYGVDVATGVENALGKKDPMKMQKFVEEVRKCIAPG